MLVRIKIRKIKKAASKEVKIAEHQERKEKKMVSKADKKKDMAKNAATAAKLKALAAKKA